ncbi:MAG: hypothetical protein GX998_09930 [Firmicutes bacterium]|nr:hypothetical protein [Bacillota bacterium]
MDKLAAILAELERVGKTVMKSVRLIIQGLIKTYRPAETSITRVAVSGEYAYPRCS